MNTFKSMFKGYQKFDETQDSAFQQKSMKRCILYAAAVALVLAILVGVIVGAVLHDRKNNSSSSTPAWTPGLTPAASLKSVCDVTHYPDACLSSISKLSLSKNTTDPITIFKLSLNVIVDELKSIYDEPNKLINTTDDEAVKSTLRLCGNLLDDAMYSVNDTVSAMEGALGKDNILDSNKIGDLRTWLSSALTYYETCFDTFDEFHTDSKIPEQLKTVMRNSTEFTSNSLVIATKVLATLKDLEVPIHARRLLSLESPSWVSPSVRRLLEANNLTPNVTVAVDGSGNVKTIKEAVAKIPDKGETRFLIYVKSGTYVENVVVDKNKWNVMVYGDGMAKTIISGSNSHQKGYRTSESATLSISGKGFVMKDIGIINTAGPSEGQAVAFHSKSDFSVYYRCSFDSYQDTLYPHSNRQFYRDCDVTGTVDFICGYATVIFQNCNIRPRQSPSGNINTITAQSRSQEEKNTGIAIQGCKISANGNVTATTYLGRPWADYSTTVVMKSNIGAIVSPKGWLAWGSKPHIYIGEYKNYGPGAKLTDRVTWDTYRPVMSDADADRFSVSKFLGGGGWIRAAGVNYD